MGDSTPSASSICPKLPYTLFSKLTIPNRACQLNVTGFKPLFMLHNFLLSAGSGLLLALMLEEVRDLLLPAATDATEEQKLT